MNLQIITDLACETYVLDDEKNLENGIISSLEDVFGYDVIKTEITNDKGKALTGKEIGKYLTLYTGNVYKYTQNERKKISSALAICIKELIADFNLKGRTFLAVGLGNRHIISDSLGVLCIEGLVPSHHLKGNRLFSKFDYDLASLSIPVLGQSGIECGDLIKKAAELLGADCLIIIDSCVTSSLPRLSTTIQVSNTGIFPGGGIKSGREKISREKTGVPVISIGVPTTISSSTLLYYLSSKNNLVLEATKNEEQIFLSPSDIDLSIRAMSEIIDEAIIKAIRS